MLKKIMLSVIVLMLCAGCTIFRTSTDTISEKEINTITKTTEIRSGFMNGEPVDITIETYEEAISKEVALAEQKHKVDANVPSPSVVAKGLLASIGIPPELINSIMLLIAGLGAKKGYDTVRDAQPRTKKSEPMKEL